MSATWVCPGPFLLALGGVGEPPVRGQTPEMGSAVWVPLDANDGFLLLCFASVISQGLVNTSSQRGHQLTCQESAGEPVTNWRRKCDLLPADVGEAAVKSV